MYPSSEDKILKDYKGKKKYIFLIVGDQYLSKKNL